MPVDATFAIEHIDATTKARILASGFEYPPGSGQVFSTSEAAQGNWTALYTVRDVIDYAADPPKVRTRDDRIEVTFTSAAEVEAAFLTGFATINGVRKAGMAAKAGVIAAADYPAANSIAAAY